MKPSRLIYGLLAALLILAVPPAAPAQHKLDSVPCTQCHSCAKPTSAKPCLRACPRPGVAKSKVPKGPDKVILNEIEREYEAVVFDHRIHAEMSAMDVGCADCHHYTEVNNITACRTCHPPAVSEENIKQPGLKGAYHRQCMGCHQEWSGESNCEVCHAKKGSGLASGGGAGSFRRYGSIEEPEIKVWESSYGGGTKVTLHHRAHTEEYGIECSSCHHAEGCKSCHSRKEATMSVRHSEEALHAICNSCHAEMSCNQCHRKDVAPKFSHERTGWPLNRYHRNLACRACHGNPNHFTKPVSTDCNGCHPAWSESTFKHSKTGVALDETHREFECKDCHQKRNFAVKPSCTTCHDNDVTFPAKVPGTLVKR